MSQATVRKWTSGEVVAALRRHYGDGYALVEQVANGTGARAERHLDAVAFGLWPSRGLAIHGIEIKVSKADLRRELAEPLKAEAVARFCDRFYIAAPAEVVSDMVGLGFDMHAPGWGILAVSGGGDQTRVTVAREAADKQADPIDRGFVAAVLRRLPNLSDEARTEIRNQLWEEHREALDREREVGGERARAELDRVRADIREAEEAAGFPLAQWGSRLGYGGTHPRHFGEAIRYLAKARGDEYDALRRRLTADANHLAGIARRVAEEAEQMRTVAAWLDGEGEAPA